LLGGDALQKAHPRETGLSSELYLISTFESITCEEKGLAVMRRRNRLRVFF
jgi:hypothetical protein